MQVFDEDKFFCWNYFSEKKMFSVNQFCLNLLSMEVKFWKKNRELFEKGSNLEHDFFFGIHRVRVFARKMIQTLAEEGAI